MESELARTQQALEIAREALQRHAERGRHFCSACTVDADSTLSQIDAALRGELTELAGGIRMWRETE